MDEPTREKGNGLMDEMAGSLDQEWEDREPVLRRSQRKERQKRSWAPIIVLIGAIAVLSLVIQWAARSRTSGEYQRLASKLESLERRVAALENKKGPGSELISKIYRMEGQIGGLETSIAALSKRMDSLTQQVTAAKTKGSVKKPKSTAKRIYKVQKGDTLFGIAKRYGVRVDSLCRANGLSSKAVLHPGQRLVIPPK